MVKELLMEKNELSKNAHGGTEQMLARLHKSLPKKLLEKYQIIPSRVRELDPDKLKVYWVHDLPGDPEAQHLANGGWSKFHRIVFVSHWQRNEFMRVFDIPYSRTAVLLNAIEPIPVHEKPRIKDGINIIYHTTPHRGLALLLPVFDKLQGEYGDKIHLDVYSSFKIYGWEERDEEPNVAALIDTAKNMPHVTYHGYKPNIEIRSALKKAHIFGYPSIWPETSCISLMEAMSAGVMCCHPDFAALPETSANWTFQYAFHEDPNRHAGNFYGVLKSAIEIMLTQKDEEVRQKLGGQKMHADLFYNWMRRKLEWESFLRSFEHEPTKIEDAQEMYVYQSRRA